MPAAMRSLPTSPRAAAWAVSKSASRSRTMWRLAVELSRSRKTDIAPASHQQWTADLLLQTLDLLAQRGLGDM